jgi:hypothetical protein
MAQLEERILAHSTERWTLLDDNRVMVVHPDRPPKFVYPDGRVEKMAAAISSSG